MFQFAPLLWGAGLGALGGLLTGQDPLKGAAIGGATGGLLGNIPAGAFSLEPAKVAVGGAPTGMGVSLAPVAADAPLSFSLAPNAVSSGAGVKLTNVASSTLPNASVPLVDYGFNPVANIAGKGSIDNLSQYSTGTGTNIMAKTPTMWDEISPYMNVRDLGGAAMIGAQYQQKPQRPQAPSGGIKEGRAPQGTDVMALLQTIKQPEKKRISLV